MRRTPASTWHDAPSPTFPPPSQMFSVERRAVAATTSYDVYDESGGYVAKIERELLSLTPQVDKEPCTAHPDRRRMVGLCLVVSLTRMIHRRARAAVQVLLRGRRQSVRRPHRGGIVH